MFTRCGGGRCVQLARMYNELLLQSPRRRAPTHLRNGGVLSLASPSDFARFAGQDG